MSKITDTLLPEYFEFIRDRIAEILIDELNNQYVNKGNYFAEARVFVERSIAFDKTELPALNVSVGTGTYSSQHQGQSLGDYVFFLDVHTSAKHNDTDSADKVAAIHAQRLAGLVRAILENPIYKTLGFATPSISRRYMEKFDIAAPKENDAMQSSMIRQYFHVSVVETSKLIVPTLIAGYDTVVKVNNTNEGYQYSGNTYE